MSICCIAGAASRRDFAERNTALICLIPAPQRHLGRVGINFIVAKRAISDDAAAILSIHYVSDNVPLGHRTCYSTSNIACLLLPSAVITLSADCCMSGLPAMDKC